MRVSATVLLVLLISSVLAQTTEEVILELADAIIEETDAREFPCTEEFLQDFKRQKEEVICATLEGLFSFYQEIIDGLIMEIIGDHVGPRGWMLGDWKSDEYADFALKVIAYGPAIRVEPAGISGIGIYLQEGMMVLFLDDIRRYVPDAPAPVAAGDPLALYDSNNNSRISCAEAREHGIAPVYSDHPAYQYMTDRNQDGVVCE